MFYRLRLGTVLLLFLLSVGLFGCNEDERTQPDSQPSSSSLSTQAYPYPAPDDPLNSYPGPEVVTESESVTAVEPDLPLVLPTPEEGFATVGGVMIDENTRQAPPESIVYLGEIVYTDTGLPIVRLDRQKAPFTVLPPSGEFIVRNLLPGEYAVVFFTPDYSFLIDDEKTGETLFLNLEPGDVVDIGLVELPAR